MLSTYFVSFLVAQPHNQIRSDYPKLCANTVEDVRSSQSLPEFDRAVFDLTRRRFKEL